MLGFLGITFFPMLFLGVPVAFSLALATIFAYVKMGDPRLFMLIPQRMFTSMEHVVLLAIPFFILTGEIMNRAQLTDKLVKLAGTLVGGLRGGLAHTNIMSSMLFAGITGSAVADTVAIGSILIPAMKKEKYEENFTAAVTAASSVIGPIVPPSIPMLIYSSVMNVSVAGMFLGGFMPGILVGLCLMVIAWIISFRKGYGIMRSFPGFMALLAAMRDGVPALLMPVIIMGGILGGFFSPTQASAVAALYGLIVGFVFYRTLHLRDLRPILKSTVSATAMILFLLACAKSFSWLIAYTQLVKHVTNVFLSISTDKVVILLIMNLILLVAGMFLDMGFSIVVLAPLMAPVAYSLGVHPIHFGLIICVNLTIGLATPPLGLILFAACGIGKVTLTNLSKAIVPFLLAEVFALLLITYIPFFTLYFPKIFGYVK